MTILETTSLTVTYGGLHANDNVDLLVPQGSFVGLIGPNGAGKTTFIDALTGFTMPSKGRVTFKGEDITAARPHARAVMGLARTFQSLDLFEDLPVIDNLDVAAVRPRWWGMFADIILPNRGSGQRDGCEAALEQLGITHLRDAYPSDLSQGQRKLVGVARALAAAPDLVLLDEPAAGLDTKESQELGRQLRGLLDRGMTVFLIDHDMGLVLSVCDLIYVLDFGRIIASGTPAEVRNDPSVIAAYLGKQTVEQEDVEDPVSILQREAESSRAAHPRDDGVTEFDHD